MPTSRVTRTVTTKTTIVDGKKVVEKTETVTSDADAAPFDDKELDSFFNDVSKSMDGFMERMKKLFK